MNWLITGASSGLGRALAQAALARGDLVAGTVRTPAALADFEALAPDRAKGFVADMADEDSVRAAVEGAIAAFGGLDVLVNNAGYGLVGAVEEASLAEVRAQFEVNVFGPIAAIQAALPHMREKKAGHIVNVTSVSGLAAWAGTGIYCGSKHALEGIGRTLAQEVAPLGIKVTNVEPGGMRTDYAGRSLTVTQRKIADYDQTAHNAERILGGHAGQEGGDPAKVAAAILRIAGAEDAPVQLLLGADAVHYATQARSAFEEEFGRWAALSLSTAFDA
ncbi:MAG: short-chain dehydrogenase/reductase [Phenylobacterium sp.]|nr:short-chain dehydrogenase/reductase [Phenylobacterium sp.]